ncbi:hypothetical protein VTH06DRAFT_8335 [Thermothelomyces fergusii]
MDGTYGNIFPANRAMSPAAQTPPSTSNLYKVNVNRQKTKKWANFKPQNYDGDDWGDDFDAPVQEVDFPMPPKPMGPRSPVTSSPTSWQFQRRGSQPLPASPQQSSGPAPAGPVTSPTAPVQPSASGALPRSSTEPFGSSRQHRTELDRPPFPPDGRSGPSALPTTHPLPSQLGLKSTIGANNVAGGYGAAQESGTGPKPWMSLRSASPSSPGQLFSRDKPLPPIRPHQMQEEKEIGHQSFAAKDNTKNNDAKPARPSNPTAEKQGGHLSDELLDSSGSEAPTPGSSQAEREESQESVLPDPLQGIRRFSTSPQLPDLGRMSGFGEDLFSSALFPSSGLRSSLSGSSPLAALGNRIPESDETTAATAGASDQSITAPARGRVATSTDTPATAEAEAAPSPVGDHGQDQHRPAVLPSPPGAAETRQPAASTEQPPTALTARPHLPGGWISETPSPPAGAVLPSPTGHPSRLREKVTEDRARIDIVPPDVPKSQPPILDPDEKGDGSVPSHQTSPQSSSQPSTPASVSNPGESSMGPSQVSTVGAGHRGASPAPMAEDAKFSISMSAEAKAKHAEVAPAAPLNARRGTLDVNAHAPPVLSPPSPAEPVLDSATQSPVKDSDILSEEILRSLSSPQTSTAAYQAAAAAGPGRESSYLGDVYGDYWSAAEDKAEPALLQIGKAIDVGKATQAAPPPPTKLPEDGRAADPADEANLGGLSSSATAVPAKTSDSVEPKSALGVGSLQRQFSWEAGSAAQGSPTASASKAAAELPVEQKSLGSGVETTRALTAENINLETGKSQPSQTQEGVGRSAEDLRAEFAPEFNPAATLGISLGLDRPRQSPSPASDSTSKQGEQKRLSLAEENIPFEEASSSTARPLPPEQKPAFANGQQAPRAEAPEAASSRSILGFRNIMELNSVAERIKHFNESRWYYSAVDTGLEEWLQAMMVKHPEHANDASSNAVTAVVHHPSNLGGRGTTLHMSNLQHSLSGLGHSGNQVGTKSKELLMAAGKAGKGLFSKGRNKLRGTGDKVFSSG